MTGLVCALQLCRLNLYGEAAALEQADLRPRQFHDPGSFTPLLLLMRPVGGGGYTV